MTDAAKLLNLKPHVCGSVKGVSEREKEKTKKREKQREKKFEREKEREKERKERKGLTWREGQTKVLHSAADVEGHLGFDDNFYLLDFSRTFPPVTPDKAFVNGHLYQLFRRLSHILIFFLFFSFFSLLKCNNNTLFHILKGIPCEIPKTSLLWCVLWLHHARPSPSCSLSLSLFLFLIFPCWSTGTQWRDRWGESEYVFAVYSWMRTEITWGRHSQTFCCDIQMTFFFHVFFPFIPLYSNNFVFI